MKRMFFIIGMLSFALSSFQSSAQASTQDKNLYIRMYEQFENTPSERAIEELAGDYQVSLSVIQNILEKPTDVRIRKIPDCQEAFTTDQLTSCLAKFMKKYAQKRDDVIRKLENITLTQEITRWSDGTLANSSFDIVVDLNIIDIILFGPNATIPIPIVPGKVFDDIRERRYGDMVDPLGRPKGSSSHSDQTQPDSQSNENSEDSSDDSESSDENSSEGSSQDNQEDSDTTPQMCRDPDALFFETSNGQGGSEDTSSQSNGEDATENGNNETGNENQDAEDESNVSDPPHTPNAENNEENSENENPENDQSSCEGDEIPLFHGTMCVPKFCEDLLCVFVEMKPGRAFALAPQETPACIECMIRKADEIFQTAVKIVQPPKKACRKRFCIQDFFSSTSLAGVDFKAVSKSLPGFASSPDIITSESAKVQSAFNPVPPLSEPKDQISSASNTESVSQADEIPSFDNYAFAKLVWGDDCQSEQTTYPSDAILENADVLQNCKNRRASDEELILALTGGTKSFLKSSAERETQKNIEDEFFTSVHGYTRKFQESMSALTAQMEQFSVEEITKVSAQCPS